MTYILDWILSNCENKENFEIILCLFHVETELILCKIQQVRCYNSLTFIYKCIQHTNLLPGCKKQIAYLSFGMLTVFPRDVVSTFY